MLLKFGIARHLGPHDRQRYPNSFGILFTTSGLLPLWGNVHNNMQNSLLIRFCENFSNTEMSYGVWCLKRPMRLCNARLYRYLWPRQIKYMDSFGQGPGVTSESLWRTTRSFRAILHRSIGATFDRGLQRIWASSSTVACTSLGATLLTAIE